ncbi:MAG: HigA family addiction module antitoxin [Treponema sp.]|jgi:addiction module HigA family antidote|nr:HigA family addiction module antitoxin [Treponema sp.]
MSKSSQTPAVVLKSLMDEYQLSNLSLSKRITLSPSMVNQLVSGQSKLTIPVVLRLAKFFGKPPAFWLDLQRKMLLEEANGDKKLQSILKGIPKAQKPAAKPKSGAVKAKPKSLSEKRKKAAKTPGAKSASRTRKSK